MDPNSTDGMWSSADRGGNQQQGNNMQNENEKSLKNQNLQTPDSQTPTHSDGYTMIPPNESRRSKLQRMAQKELEDLNKWKEEHRPGPIELPPERLGGGVSLAEARQKQQVDVRQSKLQKKLKQEEMDRRRRKEEEEEYERMKAIQREKAIKKEQKDKQDEERRKELYQHDLRIRREEHLRRLEGSSSVPTAACSSSPASSWARGHEYREAQKAEEQLALQRMQEEARKKSEMLEEKQKQQEEDRKRRMENQRLRVNSAFLDRLEARGSGRESQSQPQPRALEGASNIWQTKEEPQDRASSPVPFPSQVLTDSSEEEMEDADHDWAVMRLQSDFPYYERDLLQDILSQCKGDYQKAYDLLNV